MAGGIVWLFKRGDPEVRAIRRERKDNERSSSRAATLASERVAASSALRREVRHVQRERAAEESGEDLQRRLDRLYRGEAEGGGGEVEAPPPAPAT